MSEVLTREAAWELLTELDFEQFPEQHCIKEQEM